MVGGCDDAERTHNTNIRMRPGDLAARPGGPELASAVVVAWMVWAAARGFEYSMAIV